MAHYESSEFDVKKKLRIQFKDQPVVDTGGVTREFYTKLFQVIGKMFFQGGKYKSPVYSADIVASGLMRYFGTVIVHSILQGLSTVKCSTEAVDRRTVSLVFLLIRYIFSEELL